jgi:transposase
MAGVGRFVIPDGWVARGWRFEVETTTPEQRSLIQQHFGARRFAYNWALAQVKANLDARAADPSMPALAWTLPTLRKAWNQAKTEVAPWWPNCSKEAYGSGIADLVAALNAWFASSKTHHGCGGYREDLALKERRWVCPRCGDLVDRNANAACNLRDWTGPVIDRTVQRGGVAAPVPFVGDHGGQAHWWTLPVDPTGWGKGG